ncbi:primosomal protein N' [Knoellia sp. 3-2P3]|uniref:primosomal protein N' n=1 Tax=unclassified Knoellia TaxID=2618719 RepID=UPI0023D9A79B|nr:primosomal protein N' [Knoellia sp. 3-2P3]MDF2091818.1 primosomal protein N' [Knoellia sp. 3-2P3]
MGDIRGQETTGQLELIRSGLPRKPRRTTATEATAAHLPVASVQVDTGLAHLDRPFEYSVPESLAETAQPGVRVKVRFAGQDLDGFVLERRAEAEHGGRLAPLRRVVSPEPVLVPPVLAVARATAERYAGTLGDVLRLAIPPRHAAAEKALPVEPSEQGGLPAAPEPSAWERYPAGRHFLAHLEGGGDPAASWLALPSTTPSADWPAALAEAARAALAGGRGSVIVVPDHRDVSRVDAALTDALGPGRHVRLTADQGPQARYTAWLKVLRGHVQVVVGTRSAAFAPVRDLGLAAWWDDGDDLHEEPRAPYPHVREVLATRARIERAALLSAGFARTTAVQSWVESGAVKPLEAPAPEVRRAAPHVRVAGEGAELERDPAAASAHLPSVAWRTAKEALARGPVLVQVPRRGYLPSMSCQTCRAPARCPQCHGPIALPAPGAAPACRWCGRGAAGLACARCGGHALRSSVVGARRTAEELGRAFPGVPVHTSGSGEVLHRVAATPSLVIATPGAEPVAEGGYAAVLLLDAWASLDRPVLTAGEEAVRRWLGAAALGHGSGEGGVAVLCGAPTHTALPAVEALVRWAPAWFAERELGERRELRLPPTVRMASLVAPRRVLEEAVESLRALGLPAEAEVLGPLPAGDEAQRDLLRVPLESGVELTAALAALRGIRSAHKEAVTVAVRVDPPDIGS